MGLNQDNNPKSERKKHSYKNYFKEFSKNISYAARTWHSYVHLQNQAAQDEELYRALDRAAEFWNDYTYAAPQTTIIFLGKIFDPDHDAFNIDKLINAASSESEYFSKPKLRQRKVETAGEFEGLDEYVNQAFELDRQAIKAIKLEVKKAKLIWKKMEDLRNKVYAHNEMLSDDERKGLYISVKNDDVSDIIQILLNIQNALRHAEWNGSEPDFSYSHREPIRHAISSVDQLIYSLKKET